MNTDQLKYIFVSHSSKDWNKVRIIRNYLEDRSFYPLLFHLKCLETNGEDLSLLQDLLHREIISRRRFLYCRSENSIRSKFVQWELEQVQAINNAIFMEINLDDSSNIILNKLSVWTDYLTTIGFIGTWRSRIIQNRIIENLRKKDINIKSVHFEDDEHIPIWNGSLPQGALEHISCQIKNLDKASLVIGLKTSDYYVRGFCSRAEYSVTRNGLRFLSFDIPESECNNPNEYFICELVDSILDNYFI